MTSSSSHTKFELIVETLRNQIKSGKLKPGQRLPNRSELLVKYGISNETLQRAAAILLEDGYLVATRGVGTRVAEHPPHLCNFGIVIPQQSLGFESKLWKTIRRVAGRLELGEDRKLVIYYGGLDKINRDDEKLIEDVEHHRLAGVLFTTNHARFHNTAVLKQSDLPRVVWSGAADDEMKLIQSSVGFDYSSMLDLAVEKFAMEGRKRIAVISAGSSLGSGLESHLLSRINANGAICPSKWRLAVHVTKSFAARNIVELLMSGDQGVRPDGLLITDDNLEHDVCAGLIKTGIRIPEDLYVICHANFPMDSAQQDLVSLFRVGYDINQTVIMSLDLLQKIRRGDKVPFLQFVKAEFGKQVE